MANNRIGLGKNQGKGFKNIIPNQDAKTHSNSAKGMKQPQKVNVEGLVRQAQVKGKKQETEADLQKRGQFFEVEEVGKEPSKGETSEVEKLGAETKTQAFVKRTAETGKKALEFARKQLKARQERKSMEKIKLLEEIDHPVTMKLDKQKSRVAELKTQIALNEDDAREDKLFNELRSEENQLRELQEKATGLQLQELNDSELKTLAIRYQPSQTTGFIADFVGIGGDNPYQKELVRRITKKQEVETQVSQARSQAKKGQSSSGSDPLGNFVGDFFSP